MQGALQPIIVVHGGAGSRPEFRDGCARAAETGWKLLGAGERALEVAVESVAVMEDDGRFNAGIGSAVRLDGETVEMDAGVMDSDGRLGAVAALRGIRHPVRLAYAVTATPHVMLAGEGARRLALRLGLEPLDQVSPRARERHARLRQSYREGKWTESWRTFDLAKAWNFDASMESILGESCDTVGVVVRDAMGGFAVAGSTGGCSPMLLGRVGDTPIVGAGFLAGKMGAVSATGIGEAIVRRMLAAGVYAFLAGGVNPQEACERAVADFPNELEVGLIAVSHLGYGIAANRDMAAVGTDAG